jgi:ArsR family transcriptional regulator, zinc-responsive transcriptional repressor
MGISKTELFTKKQNELANIAKALGHPARIAILQHLVKANACICNDLVGELGLAQPTISQHLKELKQLGLIQGTIEGTSVCYCIDPKIWEKYKKLFGEFFVEIKTANKAACEPGCC